MSSQGTLISEKSLKQAQGRFGTTEILTVLDTIETLLRRGDNRSAEALLAYFDKQTSMLQNREENRKAQIARVLLQDAPDLDLKTRDLVSRINGVSELATVPHQTPQARVTPRIEGRDGDREKHQLS